MDFSFTAEEEKFRDELRSWLEANLPDGWIEGTYAMPEGDAEKGAFLRDWQRKLFEGGWAGISWPKEYGGRGVSLIEEVIYEQEMVSVKAPPALSIVGASMVGPTLLQIGTTGQKEKYIHEILNGEEVWCQGYSEPGAGSDLAAIQTKAVKQGENWIINGQKTWTSWAQFADRCFLLARTEDTGNKHEGITAFIVDLNQEGVERQTIRSINDKGDLNEMFFDNAIVHESDVVGEVNDGWRVGLMLLSHERVGVAKQVFRLQKIFEELIDLTKNLKKNGKPLIQDPIIRQKLVGFRVETRASLLIYYRHLTQTIRNGRPGPEGSIDKLVSSELLQRILAFAVSIQGESSLLWKENALMSPSWQHDYLHAFAMTIGGGTSEIQRNIVAERILGLPKDIKH